jgi:hypothetical protein
MRRNAFRPDPRQINLPAVFGRVQEEMLSQLAVGRLLDHTSSTGTATESLWLKLLQRYLPKRYRSTAAFVVDSRGRRSRQIDIAVFDNLYSPLLIPHSSGLHIPAESVYAVFEVKPTISRQWIRDASEKAASVRVLQRTSVPPIGYGCKPLRVRSRPILAGLLATGSVWDQKSFEPDLRRALVSLPALGRLDLGCSLLHGAFEHKRTLRVTPPDESLIFFILRLLERLREMGTAPSADLMQYGRGLRSFQNIKCPEKIQKPRV